jgi:DNA-directed RNA polymerase specialized sigma24 family protein
MPLYRAPKEVDLMSSDAHGTQIQGCIDRLHSGDQSARDELLVHAADRLTRLTRKMLRDFPGVHRWEETDDVLQNAAMRLCRALGEVQPPTAADFFRLATAQVRRELLDLARRHSGAHGLGAHHASVAGVDKAAAVAAALNPMDATHDPAEERETFDLLFYQGLSQAEAAAVLDVSERTIKRRWQTARRRLVQTLRGKMPRF